MNYYIDDICDYLEIQGYTNVKANFTEPTDKACIAVNALRGDLQPNQLHGEVNFEVRIVNKNRRQAQLLSESLLALLQNRRGKLVVVGSPVFFLHIQTPQSTAEFVGVNKQNASEFIILFWSNIRMPDLNIPQKN
jgi:hypothetical protein